MDGGYNIVYQDEPEWGIIGGGISSYNKEQAGDDSSEMLCFVLKDPDQQVVGGLIGSTHYEWLQVDLMWVKEDLRGRGFGRRLL